MQQSRLLRCLCRNSNLNLRFDIQKGDPHQGPLFSFFPSLLILPTDYPNRFPRTEGAETESWFGKPVIFPNGKCRNRKLVRETNNFPERKVLKQIVGSGNQPFSRTESAETESWFGKPAIFLNGKCRNRKLVRETNHFPERTALKQIVGSGNQPFSRTESAEIESWFGKPAIFPNGKCRNTKLVRETSHFPERKVLKQIVGSGNQSFFRTDSTGTESWFGKPAIFPNGKHWNRKLVRETNHFPERKVLKQKVGSGNRLICVVGQKKRTGDGPMRSLLYGVCCYA